MSFAALVVLLLTPMAIAFAATPEAVAPVGPFTVDMTDRENVRRFWFDVHEAANDIPINWTGSIDPCNPGTVSQDFRDATLSRINYFRAMAGVPSDTTFTAENNAKAQAMALMVSANRAVSHNPPQSWRCWSELGFSGRSSNLQGGLTGPRAIDSLMKDGDATEAGHRRNTLNPQVSVMGSGSVPTNDLGFAAEAQFLQEPAAGTPQRPARDGFVAWPPKGFVPYQVVFPRWSFVLRGADFTNATVTMQSNNGATIQPPIESRVDWAGPGIVWLANGLNGSADWPKPVGDEPITVTVANVVVNGIAQDFTYTVNVFDPAVGDPTNTPLVISGPDRPPLDQASTYSINAVPNALGYQWRTSKLNPFNLTDGAEGGLANFERAVSNYNPISTTFAAAGQSSFRLTTGQGDPAPAPNRRQTLTLKPTLVANENSQLTFKTRASRLANVTSVVEVSADDGATWKVIYQEQSTDDTAFNDRAVPLGPLAGQHLRLRLRVENAGTGATGCCGQEGWYVDDLTFSNLQAADAPTLSAVSPATSFPFTPTSQAEFDLDVRPNFAGSGFGDWSKAKRLSTLPAHIAPAITVQPVGLTVADGGTASFTVSATGTPPLEFVWSRDGADLVDGAEVSGSRTATLTLTNVRAAQAGSYRVRVSSTSGPAPEAVDSDLAVLVVTPGLATALDGAALRWSTSGNGSWAPETTITHDGVDAAQSAAIGDNQFSRVETIVTGPATLSYWWKVDSEAGFDFLTVAVDGVAPFAGISGNVDWQQKTIALPAGPHSIRWDYTMDASVSVGQNAAWLDEVSVGPPEEPLTLAGSLDNFGIPFTTGGDLVWGPQDVVTHDGVDAARSGGIGDNQTSSLDATVTGPATLSFWWKVDSEQSFDFLSVTVDGIAPFAGISGNVDWQQRTITLPAGTHTVRWSYTMDGSVASGQNAGWVDQVVLTQPG